MFPTWFIGRRVAPTPSLRFAALPRVLWIELTSKCPFDCVFCSRRLRRGAGTHMDMALYARVLGELVAPEVIRLNYSGESTHHPEIVDAIRLAAATGATTELVTALGSLPDRMIEPLALSGLDRLTVSLHTLDARQFDDLYRHASLAAVLRKLGDIAAARDRAGATRPRIDLAVVAMQRNVRQLMPLARFAHQTGMAGISIHPVIRRDPTPDPFVEELDDDRLRPEFLRDLAASIEEVRRALPDLPVAVSTPEGEGTACIGDRPVAYPGPLPEGARIHSCHQNPWDTVHILADGTVVTCEVRDRIAVGRIAVDASAPGLAALWNGPAYETFRAQYRQGAVPECVACPYKTAFLPGAASNEIDAAAGANAQLLHGWHGVDGSGLLWSKRAAAMELARPHGARWLSIEGWMPQRVDCVDVVVDGQFIGRLRSAPDVGAMVKRRLRLPRSDRSQLTVLLHTERPLVPCRAGLGPDIRELGFGLKRAAVL